MNSVGVVRNIDDLGRIVLPRELRGTLEIPKKCSLEFYLDDEIIVIKKYQPGCIFCGDVDDVVKYKGKNICSTCLTEMKTSI